MSSSFMYIIQAEDGSIIIIKAAISRISHVQMSHKERLGVSHR